MTDISIPPMKRCTQCKIEKPATTDYFYRYKPSKDGLTAACKICIRTAQKNYLSKPGIRESRNEQGRMKRAETRDEYNRKKREDRATNPEKYREWQRVWTEKNRARRLEQSRKGTRNYTKKHPIERQVAIHRRRAHKLELPSTFTADEWRSCLAYWKHCCCICGRPAGFWHTIAIEHWIPLNSKQENNPGNVKSNVLPLCHGIDGCNNSKGTKDPIEWLIAKFGKRKAKAILKRISDYFDQLG
jgi:hypothetical protein